MNGKSFVFWFLNETVKHEEYLLCIVSEKNSSSKANFKTLLMYVLLSGANRCTVMNASKSRARVIPQEPRCHSHCSIRDRVNKTPDINSGARRWGARHKKSKDKKQEERSAAQKCFIVPKRQIFIVVGSQNPSGAYGGETQLLGEIKSRGEYFHPPLIVFSISLTSSFFFFLKKQFWGSSKKKKLLSW